jgi:hypothetical protein
MAGTPQKMLEHLLETRLDGRGGSGSVGGQDSLPTSSSDPFLEDFLLTHIVFMPTHQLVTELSRQYPLQIFLHCYKYIQVKLIVVKCEFLGVHGGENVYCGVLGCVFYVISIFKERITSVFRIIRMFK